MTSISHIQCWFPATFLYLKRDIKNVTENEHCWNVVKIQIYQLAITNSFNSQNIV